jgi:HEPN domain-containing protein
MSVDYNDAAMDEMYEHLSRELYPEHKQQAIAEFTNERLRSYYVSNSEVMRPAVRAMQEAKALAKLSRYSAALVFSASAYELFLKATLLRPVLHGLVHNPALAEILVQRMLGTNTDIRRYEDLLSRLFETIAGLKLESIRRSDACTTLIKEVVIFQRIRNGILHAGDVCTPEQAMAAQEVALAIFMLIVEPLLSALGLFSDGVGVIRSIPEHYDEE